MFIGVDMYMCACLCVHVYARIQSAALYPGNFQYQVKKHPYTLPYFLSTVGL